MSTAEDNALALILSQRAFADALVALSETELRAAMAVALGLGGGLQDQAPPAIQLAVPTVPDLGNVPEFDGVLFNPVEFTASEPTPQSIPQLDLSGQPGAVPTLPTYVAPALPTLSPVNDELLLQFPAVRTDFAIAEPPDLLAEIRGITKPVLSEIDLPVAPTYSPPEFTGIVPADPGAPPTGLDVLMRSQYATIAPVFRAAINGELDAYLDREFPQHRAGLAAIETRLATYLEGGTALTSEVQDLIYGRSQDKVNAEGRRAKGKLYEEGAGRGFTMVSPALLSQVRQLDQAGRDNNARAASDLAVKIAEMEQANLQFAITQGKGLRELAINSGVQYTQMLVTINAQALDYAREVVANVVKTYELSIRRSEIQVRVYEAEGRIYEARLRGAEQVIEIYKARIQGELAKVQVDHERVAAYGEFIRAVQAEADVYKATVEFVKVQGDLEKLKVELYDAKSRGVIAQVNANTSRWEGYKAAVQGAIAPIQASGELVHAYVADSQRYEAIVRARATAIESVSRTNDSATRLYQAKADVNRTLNQTKAEVVRAQIEGFDAELKGFVANANAISDHSRAQISYYETVFRSQIEQGRLYIERLRERDTLLVERTRAVATIAGDIGRNYANTASAALSGLNSLISVVANDA